MNKEFAVDQLKKYWKKLSQQIEKFCKTNNIKYINYFYHEELVINNIIIKNGMNQIMCF